jgi:hypothetical protein
MRLERQKKLCFLLRNHVVAQHFKIKCNCTILCTSLFTQNAFPSVAFRNTIRL